MATEAARARERLNQGLPLGKRHAALLLDLHPETVSRWCREERIAGSLATGRWMIPASEIRRLLATGRSA